MNLFKMPLSSLMALAIILGIIFGLFFGDFCIVFAPWASAYIMLLKMTTIPYLIVAIIHGIGQLSSLQASQILKKGILFIGLALCVNITFIYLIFSLFPGAKNPGQLSYVPNTTSPINFAELLIPENIFYALSNNIIPAVVIFSLLIGLALMYLRKKEELMHSLETTVEALTCVTSWISRITPFGTFLIVANQVGTIHLTTIKQVSTYIILYTLGISVIVFWAFPRLVSMLTSLHTIQWLKYTLPILILAYTTNVVIVCLPYIIALVQKETQELDPKDAKAQSQIQGTVSIIFNLPLGSLFITVFVLFMGIFYNIPLDLIGQIKLFSISFLTGLGSVGLGSWINNLSFIFDFLGLPLDGLNLYLVTLPFTAGFQSMVSAMEITVLSLLITLACRKQLHFSWIKILKSCTLTLIPIVLLFGGLKTLNLFPLIEHEAKSICKLEMRSDVKATIYNEDQQPSLQQETSSNEDTFDRIMRTKVLRVGYYPDIPPFCFLNQERHIVGYDTAFAYELAHDLGCRLELIPLKYALLADELNHHLYDISMSAVSMNEERLKLVSFTKPYIEAKIVFVTKDERKKDFSSLASIRNNLSLKIAVFKGSSFEALAKKLFPNHTLVLIENYESFNSYTADAIFWEEQEGISWILRHPRFAIVTPRPSIGTDILGYAIKADSIRFLNYLNQWLTLKKNEGFTQKQYDVWILGKTNPSTDNKQPRWSIIRDVLHWVH